MSKQYPECPAYDHKICKEYSSPTYCAIVRADKKCLKQRKKEKRESSCTK